MDEREARKVQREASEALLDLGVSLPLKEWRLPFMKRPVRWRVTMRRPRLAGQICIVRLYLSMDVSPEEVSAFAGRERPGVPGTERRQDIPYGSPYPLPRSGEPAAFCPPRGVVPA